MTRPLASTTIRLLWSALLLISSAYCLLAYLPYTFVAFVQAPPYAWMPWFASHHVAIYWALLVITCLHLAWTRAGKIPWAGASLLALGGCLLVLKPVLSQLRNDRSSFVFANCALILLIAYIVTNTGRLWLLREPDERPSGLTMAPLVLVAILLAGAGTAGVYWRVGGDSGASTASRWAMLLLWSVISHLTIALLLGTGFNLLTMTSNRFSRARRMRFFALCLFMMGALWWCLEGFMTSAFTMQSALATLYSGLIACSVIMVGASVFLEWRSERQQRGSHTWTLMLLLAAIGIGLGTPTVIGGNDWNGVLQRSAAIVTWTLAAACVVRMSQKSTPKLRTSVAIAVVVVFVFATLKFSEIAWSKPLGNTDDEITRGLDAYAEQDATFGAAHTLLAGSRSEPCDELCRVLREHTNIRTTDDVAGFSLVDNLQPTTGERPNIFIWIIDSMRPDYVGAYNSRANFTPELDAFARESLVFRNAYSQYAGTTLSEPAVWAGAELLHTHYLHPFERINSLQKLAKIDGYELMISRDTVLNELFGKTTEVTDVEISEAARWNSLEMCGTVDALARKLDARSDSRPVMFFSQPMNLHQFAVNNMPHLKDVPGWNTPGFNRVTSLKTNQVDGCFGKFVADLKARGLYENSIIIVSADHGDATGELGRNGHSLVLYPEIMRVPLIIHLPTAMRNSRLWNDRAVATLTDVAPSLYQLLGHGKIKQQPLFGRSLFANTREELEADSRREWFLASDALAAYGFLDQGGRYFYATYDSPARSYLYDLQTDPLGTHDILTPELKRQYDRRILEHLNAVADFYGYKPGIETFFTAHK